MFLLILSKCFFLGCWGTSERSVACEHNNCITNGKPPKAKKDTKFCCCIGNLCNSNFTDTYINVQDPTANITEILPYRPLNPQIWILSGVLFIVLMSVLIGYIIWHSKPAKCDIESCPHAMQPALDYSLDKLKLCNIIGKWV